MAGFRDCLRLARPGGDHEAGNVPDGGVSHPPRQAAGGDRAGRERTAVGGSYEHSYCRCAVDSEGEVVRAQKSARNQGGRRCPAGSAPGRRSCALGPLSAAAGGMRRARGTIYPGPPLYADLVKPRVTA